MTVGIWAQSAHLESVTLALVVSRPRTYRPPPNDVAAFLLYAFPEAVTLLSWYSTAPPPAPDASVACSWIQGLATST
jgi:hypothetical protein